MASRKIPGSPDSLRVSKAAVVLDDGTLRLDAVWQFAPTHGLFFLAVYPRKVELAVAGMHNSLRSWSNLTLEI